MVPYVSSRLLRYTTLSYCPLRFVTVLYGLVESIAFAVVTVYRGLKEAYLVLIWRPEIALFQYLQKPSRIVRFVTVYYYRIPFRG